MQIIFGENNIDWNAKGNERKAQNVANLINTYRYEIAYDRTKGMDPEIIDKPLHQMVNKFSSEVYRLISVYQPNVTVTEISPVVIGDDTTMKVVLAFD